MTTLALSASFSPSHSTLLTPSCAVRSWICFTESDSAAVAASFSAVIASTSAFSPFHSTFDTSSCVVRSWICLTESNSAAVAVSFSAVIASTSALMSTFLSETMDLDWEALLLAVGIIMVSSSSSICMMIVLGASADLFFSACNSFTASSLLFKAASSASFNPLSFSFMSAESSRDTVEFFTVSDSCL